VLSDWPVVGRDALIVGTAYGDVGGTIRAGGVYVYQAHTDGTGFDTKPVALVSGEGYQSGGGLGSSVRGLTQEGKPMLVVGSTKGTPYASETVIQNGTVYFFEMPVEP
jgi:hypothetical protein